MEHSGILKISHAEELLTKETLRPSDQVQVHCDPECAWQDPENKVHK